MNKTNSATKRLCRAGVIAALYVVFTYVFAPFAFGPFQIRPAEALCILPLFFIEAVPALFIGCAISNLTSPFLLYDVLFGSLTTLLSAFITYMVGRFFKNDKIRFALGGVAPVLLNAFIIPFIIVFLCGGAGESSVWVAYFSFVFSIFLTEAIWIYVLGGVLYFTLCKKIKK